MSDLMMRQTVPPAPKPPESEGDIAQWSRKTVDDRVAWYSERRGEVLYRRLDLELLFRGRGPVHVHYGALSRELARKVVAREKEMGSDAYRGRLFLPASSVSYIAAAGMVPSCAVFLVSMGLHANDVLVQVTGPVARISAAAVLVCMVVSLGAAVCRRVRFRRHELTLTGEEFAAVKACRTRIAAQVVDRHDRVDDASAITAVAADVLFEIETSRAWRSKHLDTERIQLDLTEELYQIVESCKQLRKLDSAARRSTPDERDTSELTAKLAEQAKEYRELHQQAREAVVTRVAALYAYRHRLSAMEGLIENIERASRAAADSDDFTETFVAITRDRQATERLGALTAGLDDLRQRLTLELDMIRGEIVASAELGAPLVLLSERAA